MTHQNKEGLEAIERFEMFADTDGERAWTSPDQHPEGDWVKYEAHITLVSSLREENERLRKERDEALENASALRGLLEYCEDSIARLQSKWQFQLERADASQAREKIYREALEKITKDRTHTAFGLAPTDGAHIAKETLSQSQEQSK